MPQPGRGLFTLELPSYFFLQLSLMRHIGKHAGRYGFDLGGGVQGGNKRVHRVLFFLRLFQSIHFQTVATA